MNILDVEIKYSSEERFFLVTTDSLFYPLLERSMSGRWFVPRSDGINRYELLNPEFLEELDKEYIDYVERVFNGSF